MDNQRLRHLNSAKPHLRRAYASAAFVVAVMLGGGAVAHATAGEATPPYDFGCIDEPPCEVESERAKQGVLDAVTRTDVCIYYTMPPTFYPCERTETSSLGVDGVPLKVDSTVNVTAMVRNVSADEADAPRLCFGMVTVDGYNLRSDGACPAVSSEDPTPITGRIVADMTDRLEGEWSLFVSLGSSGSVAVDSISYTVTPPSQ